MPFTMPCAVSWGISVHHRDVHRCHLKVTVRAAATKDATAVTVPHDGDHVCRCGDRRAADRVPKVDGARAG